MLPLRSNGKPEAVTAVYKLLMMGMRMPETCWAVFKWRAINLRDWCIWLVDLFKCAKMHGLTNPKYNQCIWYMASRKIRNIQHHWGWGLSMPPYCNWGFHHCEIWSRVSGQSDPDFSMIPTLKDEETALPRYVGVCLPVKAASQPRRKQSSPRVFNYAVLGKYRVNTKTLLDFK